MAADALEVGKVAITPARFERARLAAKCCDIMAAGQENIHVASISCQSGRLRRRDAGCWDGGACGQKNLAFVRQGNTG
jgi:hypothetical protein